MLDHKRWKIARSRLHALRDHLPHYPGQMEVSDYHSIIDALETASGEELSEFRISLDSMKPRATNIQIGSRHSPGRTTWSKEVYADSAFFKRQVDGLSRYVQNVEGSEERSSAMTEPINYWQLTDEQLEDLCVNRGIRHPYGYSQQGGGIYFDRDRSIALLLKQDKVLNPQPVHTSNVLHVETMNSSVIQQGVLHAKATVNVDAAEQKEILEQLKKLLTQLELNAEDKEGLDTDISTMQVQIDSGRPKRAIMDACKISISGVLEKVIASGMAVPVVHEISKLLHYL
jgi:hypothetical protein